MYFMTRLQPVSLAFTWPVHCSCWYGQSEIKSANCGGRERPPMVSHALNECHCEAVVGMSKCGHLADAYVPLSFTQCPGTTTAFFQLFIFHCKHRARWAHQVLMHRLCTSSALVVQQGEADRTTHSQDNVPNSWVARGARREPTKLHVAAVANLTSATCLCSALSACIFLSTSGMDCFETRRRTYGTERSTALIDLVDAGTPSSSQPCHHRQHPRANHH